MDKQDVAVKRRSRGFAFSMDAIFALALLLSTAPLLLAFLNSPSPYSKGGEQMALGVMDVLEGTRLEGLRGNPRYPYANITLANNWTSSVNGSIIESIADLYLSGRVNESYNLTAEIIAPLLTSDYSLEVLVEKNGTDCANRTSTFSCIYGNSTGATKSFVSVGRQFIYYNNASREFRVVLYK